MYILKDRKCARCENDEIIVHSYSEKDKYGRNKTIVDYGECSYCCGIEILPQEDFRTFVSQFCIRK